MASVVVMTLPVFEGSPDLQEPGEAADVASSAGTPHLARGAGQGLLGLR
jgi:hypothetical protein